jgi:hypothetical protein
MAPGENQLSRYWTASNLNSKFTSKMGNTWWCNKLRGCYVRFLRACQARPGRGYACRLYLDVYICWWWLCAMVGWTFYQQHRCSGWCACARFGDRPQVVRKFVWISYDCTGSHSHKYASKHSVGWQPVSVIYRAIWNTHDRSKWKGKP